jgi:hypothetical protein
VPRPAAKRFVWRGSVPPLCGVLRLFWLCGDESGESTGDGWETSHRASNSVQPGIACCRKVSHRSLSYLVPKTARAVMISDSREPESKPRPPASRPCTDSPWPPRLSGLRAGACYSTIRKSRAQLLTKVRYSVTGRRVVRVSDRNPPTGLGIIGFETGIPAGRALKSGGAVGAEGRSAPPTLVPPAWGVPAWRGWAHCGALWCFPH